MKNCFTLLLLFLFISFQSIAKNPYTLKLKAGIITPKANAPESKLSSYTNSTNSGEYVIIQFYKIPSEIEKKQIEENGITLLEYIPNSSFLAFLDEPSDKNIKSLNIRSIIKYLPEYKMPPSVSKREIPEWLTRSNEKIELMVEPQLNINPITFESILIENNFTISTIDPSFNFYIIEIAPSKIEALSKLVEVKFIDFIPAPPEKEDDRARSMHRGNLLDSDYLMGRKYDGTGVNIAIADDGIIGPHIDFTGRVTQYATFNTGSHGDMTSGIAIGAGNLDPTIRGAASGAYLYYYNITGYPHITNAVSNLTTRDIVITSTSYSEGCNEGYTSTTRTIDQQTRENPELLHVFSAGNSASSNCGINAYGAGVPWGTITGGRKQGKAAMTVGNLTYTETLTASSSRGPASDGRIKPDICSNGTNQMSTDPDNQYAPGGGTSAAAPGIAGLAAQLYHGYKDLNNNVNPESGLIKSVMLNTARDIGNLGPDYYYGWGRVNAHRAMKLIEENRYIDSSISINDSVVHSIAITDDLQELRIMIYWTDYEASTLSSQALVNDLDLLVITPTGDTISPWILDPTPNHNNLIAPAQRGIDTLNNVEQVLIDSATSGTYKVIVKGTSVPQGPQKYFLSWETKFDEIEVTYPFGGESFVPGEIETIRWDATGDFGSFLIEYSLDSGLNWNYLSITSGSSRSRDWLVPNTVSGNALIKVKRSLGSSNFGAIDSSDHTFSIIQTPSNISAEYICIDSIAIKWNKVSGATSYEISQLGNKYMDSIGRSDTNYFVMHNTNFNRDNWISVKALGDNIIGRRATAVLLPKEIKTCNFNIDLGIENLISPSYNYNFNCSSIKVAVALEVKNYGKSAITMVPMKYNYNGIDYLDTISGPLMPDSSLIFTFKDSINTNQIGLFTLTVNGSLIGDENYTNDTIAQQFNLLSSTIRTLPVYMSFDSTNSCPTINNCGATNCSLNAGWLNMTNLRYDDFDMRVNSGPTPSSGTGPSSDHTHENGTSVGNYIYAEASNDCFEMESQVVSPCINLINKVKPELSFWYHMYGSNVGSISIDIYSNGIWDNDVTTPIQGTQGDSWYKKTLPLDNYVGRIITVRFRVKTGTNFSSDIALDDIRIQEEGTGLIELSDDNRLKIYPNPASESIQIELSELSNHFILIFDVNGRVVEKTKSSSKKFNIDVSMLESGIYFISLEGTTTRKKLIIY